MWASDIAFITNILQMCRQKKWNSIFSFISTYFSVKKRAKRPNTFFKASQLEMRPKNSQKAS